MFAILILKMVLLVIYHTWIYLFYQVPDRSDEVKNLALGIEMCEYQVPVVNANKTIFFVRQNVLKYMNVPVRNDITYVVYVYHLKILSISKARQKSILPTFNQICNSRVLSIIILTTKRRK